MKITDLLSEDVSDPKVEAWLTSLGFAVSQRRLFNYSNGRLNADTNVDLSLDLSLKLLGYGFKKIPFKFGKVHGNFDLDQADITDLTNMPDEVYGDVIMTNCDSLTSLKGIGVDCLKRIDGHLYLGGTNITSNMLGVLKIEGLKAIYCNFGSDKLYEAVQIISKYLGAGKPGILDAQQELIDNDLDDFAEF